MDDERAEALIAASYDLATGTTRLDQIPDLMSAAMGYESVLLTLRDGLTPIELATNLPPAVVAAYAAHYYRLDPWTRAIDRTPFGTIVQSSWPEMRSSFEATEFYQDFARLQGLIDPLGVRLKVTPGLDLHVGLNQRQQAGDPDRTEMTRLDKLARHLRRGLDLRERFSAIERQNGLVGGLLDQVNFGVAALDRGSRVMFVNRPAEAIIAGGFGLVVRHGRLLAKASGDQARLESAIASVVRGEVGGESLLLHHPTHEGMVAALFSRLPAQFGKAVGAAEVLVTLTHLNQGQALDAGRLRSLFQFTTAESEIAAGIALGQSLEQLAEQRGVRTSTIRTQLDAVFAKTGVRSQRELIQFLGRLPVPR